VRMSASPLPFRAPARDSGRGRRTIADPSDADRRGQAHLREEPPKMAPIRRSSFGPIAVAMALSLLLGFGLARGLQATDDLRSQLDLFSQVLYLVQNNYVE